MYGSWAGFKLFGGPMEDSKPPFEDTQQGEGYVISPLSCLKEFHLEV